MYINTSFKYHRVTCTQSRAIAKVHDLLGQPSYMHLGMVECHISFSGHCDLDLRPSFNNYCVRSISLILFERDRNPKFGV